GAGAAGGGAGGGGRGGGRGRVAGRLRRGGRRRAVFVLSRVGQDRLADLDRLAGLGLQRGDGAGERRRHLGGGLVGHHLHERLAALHRVADPHAPADQLRLVQPL